MIALISVYMLLHLRYTVVSNSLWPHGLQHTRLLCPSLSFRACSNLCAWSQWWHPTISSSVTPFSSCPQSFPGSANVLALHIRWPKYWSFSLSISPSSEYSVLISFRMDWFDLLSVYKCMCAHIMKTFELHSLIVWYVIYFNRTITKENLWPSTYSNELYNI